MTSTDFPHHHRHEDHSWNLQSFEDNFSVQYYKNDLNDACFSLVGLDASIANAFRRILLAEIPSLAIEKVFIEENDSVISDEILAHRLGLIPLAGSTDFLHYLQYRPRPAQGLLGEDPTKTKTEDIAKETDTAIFKLEVECKYREGLGPKSEGTPEELYEHSNVYAEDLQFDPVGEQIAKFADITGDGRLKPTNPKILVAKLRPGQRISLQAWAVKGVGGDHAKFSPVATATYRLLPTIDIISPIVGADAKKFARCFPKGVIGLDNVTEEESEQQDTAYAGQAGEKKAVVKDTMKDTVSRECLRHPEFVDKVKLGRVRDHFIFSVESTGQTPSDQLFLESVTILRGKCRIMKAHLEAMPRG